MQCERSHSHLLRLCCSQRTGLLVGSLSSGKPKPVTGRASTHHKSQKLCLPRLPAPSEP